MEKYFSDLSVSHARTIFLLRTTKSLSVEKTLGLYAQDVVREMEMNSTYIYECEANKEKTQINLENIMNMKNVNKEELQSASQIIQDTLN